MSKEFQTERKLTAVLSADVEGFSRLIEADEVATLQNLASQRGILDDTITRYRGRVVNTAGDSVLAEFPSVADAVQCAVDTQKAHVEAAERLPETKRVLFRIGIHLGDVAVRGSDLLGNGVNIAARLQSIAPAGGIVISGSAHEQVRKILPLTFTDLGAQSIKNIEELVRAFAVRLTESSSPLAAAMPSEGKPLSLPDKPSIAVLPFQNMSGDPEQEYFADGMVEDIITALSRFKSLFVIARNSSFTYKGKAVDIKQVGRELGVRYVLEGSVRKAGDRVRITGQLIDAETNKHLWADRFDGAFEGIFDLQDKVTEQVVGAIAPTLELAEIDRIKMKRPESLDAYELYLKASSYLHQIESRANKEGLKLAYKAIEIDPTYGAAYGIAADFYTQRNSAGMTFDREKDVPEAITLARRAMTLSPNDPEVLTRAALAIGNLTGDVTANAILDRALDLNPNLARAWALRGAGALFVSEAERAIDFCRHALRLTPVDPSRYVAMAAMSSAYTQMEQYDEAYEWAERAYQLREIPMTYRVLITSAVLSGRSARAELIVKKLLSDGSELKIRRLMQGIDGWRGEMDKRRIRDALRLAGVPE